MAELTIEEVGLVDELRKRLDFLLVDEEQREDRFLIRWIRARIGNLDAAEKMLKESLQWREENGLKKVLQQEFPLILHQLAPYHMLGRDREGRAVVEVPFGKWDIRTLVTTVGETEFFHYTNQFLERIVEQTIAAVKDGKNDGSANNMIRTQAVVLFNFEGYSYSQLAHLKGLQNTLKLAMKYEAHYPEILGPSLVINAPRIFSILYAMVKPLCAPNTVAKITIFGSDPKSWGPVLDSLVAKDQVGPGFGGTADRPTLP